MNTLLTINPNNTNPEIASSYERKFSARGVVFDENNNVALLPVTAHKYYKLPGGGIDDGEDKVEAFRRECVEEIGTDVEVIKELGDIVEYRDEKLCVHTSHCYIARAVGDRKEAEFTERELGNGFKEAVWVPLDNAIELMKGSSTDNYFGKFIVERDLFLLEKVRDNVLVSVIIPTYNRKDIVLDAIQSVVRQTIKDFEIIVVDDGSTDGTVEYLQSLHLPINLISKENGGVSSARNLGIKNARGKYIAFLDSDDLWLPEKLEQQIAYLESHPDIFLVYTDEYIEVNGDVLPNTRFERSGVKDDEKDNFLLPGFVQHTPIHTSAVMIKKSVLDEVGYFNETLKIHEDTELWNRMSKKSRFGFINTPLATFRYREGAEHLMRDAKKQKGIEEGRKYLKLYEEMHWDDMTDKIKESIEKSHEILDSLSRGK